MRSQPAPSTSVLEKASGSQQQTENRPVRRIFMIFIYNIDRHVADGYTLRRQLLPSPLI